MNVIIAVTGSIAAYKAAVLIRELRKRDHEVKVLMTPKAKDFISPLTMATLSSNPVMVDNFSPENGQWNSHISLGMWADLMLVAPATANTIAKMAMGVADNLVLDTCLSSRAPIWVAPAMDVDMYQNLATQNNLKILQSRGIKIIEPGSGFLASGLTGKGRMAEPEQIALEIDNYFSCSQILKGKKVLVTLGATREKIDPVRFISNFSTGRMGLAIIKQLLQNGAEVYAVAAKMDVNLPESSRLHTVNVTSADEMLEATSRLYPDTDCAIFSAAVADYKPVNQATSKIKRQSKEMSIELVANPDISLQMGNIKRPGQINIGFALESSPSTLLASEKLSKKNLDAIVFNSLSDAGAGFGYDTNKITILSKDKSVSYDLKSKDEVAKDIVKFVIDNYFNQLS